MSGGRVADLARRRARPDRRPWLSLPFAEREALLEEWRGYRDRELEAGRVAQACEDWLQDRLAATG